MSTYFFPPKDYSDVPPAGMSDRNALAKVLWDSAEQTTTWYAICAEAEYPGGDLCREIRDEYLRLADAVLATSWIAVQR